MYTYVELNGFIALIVLYLQNDEVLSFDTEYSNDLSYVKNFFQLDYNVLIISLSKQQQRLGVKKHEFSFFLQYGFLKAFSVKSN